MKTKISLLAIMMFLGVLSITASETKTDEFKVYGNCGMCKSRIEKAVLSIQGVTVADWNKETKMLEVTYDKSKTSIDKIQKEIANVGHDTDAHKADDKVYENLPGCCKYDRPKSELNNK